MPIDEPVHVEYVAAADACPTESEFVASIASRAPRFRATKNLAGRYAILVRIEKNSQDSEGNLRGSIVLRDRDGETRRDVAGDACNDVVSALALIAAVSVEADDGFKLTEEKPVEVRNGPITAPAALPPSTSSPSRAPVRDDTLSTFGLGIHGSVHGGVAPEPLLTVPVFLEWRAPKHGIVAPAVRVGFERGGASTSLAAGSADFTWTAGTLDLCPVRATFGRLNFVQCARFELGALEGEGQGIFPARTETEFWFAADMIGRVEWNPVGPFFVDLQGGPRFPFTRTRFIFQPDTTVFRAPPVGWLAAAGIGIRF